MIIYPAIDIRNGKVVRLTQGDYEAMQVYGDHAVKQANAFIRDGATHLHIVDLDGAKDGTLQNFDSVKEICDLKGLFVQIGGGIRNEERIEKYLSLGAGRVILGTVAVNNYGFVEEMVRKYGGHIAVGVDARDGKVAIQGWRENTRVEALDFCKKISDTGIETIIYTDIAKDGAMEGTNLEVYKYLRKLSQSNIIASGGISFAHEIRALGEIGVQGAILGKALYENKLSLKQILGEMQGA